MVRSKDDPRLRFVVTIVTILGVVGIAIVALMVFAEQANHAVDAILAVGAMITSVIALALGYNVFVRYRAPNGQGGEMVATQAKDDT